MHHNTRHGHARMGKRSPEYRSWEGARARCRNPKDPFYKDYGGRGITFDAAWDNFLDFLNDMGPRPKGSTLERRDANGPYAKWNCEWADAQTQQRNKRSNRKVTFQGQTLLMVELSEVTGIPYGLLYDRIIRSGWSVEKAVSKKKRVWPSQRVEAAE